MNVKYKQCEYVIFKNLIDCFFLISEHKYECCFDLIHFDI